MEQDNTHLDSAEDRGKDDERDYPVIPYQEEPEKSHNGELNGGGGEYNETRSQSVKRCKKINLCKRVLIVT